MWLPPMRLLDFRLCGLKTFIRNLAEIAIDVERLAVQRVRLRKIAGEQSSGGERAEAARQRLGGPKRTHERVHFAQQALALIGAVGQQARRAGSQQHAPLVKGLAELAIETGSADRLVIVGGIVELPHVA